MRKKQAIIIAGLVLAASAVGLLACSLHEKQDDIAHIKLRLAMDGYITVHVPKKYIGPSHLELAQEVIKTDKPVNMIPLAFTYPGFKPWKRGAERRGMTEEEKKQEVFLLLQGGRGEKWGKNGLAYAFLRFNMPKPCHGERYAEKEYGLHKFKRFSACMMPERHHSQDLYFYDAPGDSEDDVMVLCPPPERTRQLCRFYINYDEMGLVNSEFSAPRALLANWQQVMADYKRFIVPFYKEEIPYRHKPKSFTPELKRELNKSFKEEWKP